MSYASREDIEAIYTPELLQRIAFDRVAQVVDYDLVDAALDHASALIDMRLSQRYTLPLSPIPKVVKGYCIDVAIYRMALTRDKLTIEMRQRYDDAIADLKDIAAGKAGLGNTLIDPDTGVTSISGATDSNRGNGQYCLMRRQG